MIEEYIEPSITYKSVQRQPKRVLQADYLRTKGKKIDGVLHLPMGVCVDDYDGIIYNQPEPEPEIVLVPLEVLNSLINEDDEEVKLCNKFMDITEEFNTQQYELQNN